jgi:multidrug efflux pump subunit AcrA (membrane-fusion protein)
MEINKRKVIVSFAGMVVLAIGILGMKFLTNMKKMPKQLDTKVVASVYVKTVKNSNVPVSISTSGSIIAKDRMMILSEVQGVFMPLAKAYKTGVHYRKGEEMIRINNEEFFANVLAKRSSFVNMITSILPDIQFDYPSSLAVWKNYLESIDIHRNLPPLPAIKPGKEKNYITAKNIYSTFYSIKNMETRLQKYSITAPYNGVLVDASVTPGTLIRPGQKLGEYIKPDVFELELNVNAGLQRFLETGKEVSLYNVDKTKQWTGKLSRVNAKIDRASQTIKIFVEVVASDLIEGEYLEADIYAREIKEAIEIPRALLVNNNSVFVVENNRLKRMPVTLAYSGLHTVVIKGLPDGVQYVSKPVVNAYQGMDVKIINDKQTTDNE